MLMYHSQKMNMVRVKLNETLNQYQMNDLMLFVGVLFFLVFS